jgi:glycosyltransferase involved in cell wall biosynthesis
VRGAASTAHRWIRWLCGSNILPTAVRHVAAFVDTRLHPPVQGATFGLDILHSSSVPLPPPNGRMPKRILTVYDLSVLRFPALYGPEYRRGLVGALRSLRPGDSVITTSQFVRDELLAEGVASSGRIHVVPLAADRTTFHPCDDVQRIAGVRRKYGIPDGPYVLGVNTPDPRKNVPHAIHAFARATRSGRDAPASFVLTGSRGPASERIGRTIAAYPELRGRFILTGYVPDEDMAPLYSGAAVFVYCSLYEGFGLPPLEAMQCATPVIASNTASMPEVIGDAGVTLAPDDRDGLVDAMLRLARADDRDGLRQRALARAAQFSWDRTTAGILHAYRAALNA